MKRIILISLLLGIVGQGSCNAPKNVLKGAAYASSSALCGGLLGFNVLKYSSMLITGLKPRKYELTAGVAAICAVGSMLTGIEKWQHITDKPELCQSFADDEKWHAAGTVLGGLCSLCGIVALYICNKIPSAAYMQSA